jgi:hypothetical protein
MFFLMPVEPMHRPINKLMFGGRTLTEKHEGCHLAPMQPADESC